MRTRADGAGRGSVLTPIADAVARFRPDHILLALRSPEHANWQEKRLIEHIEERFGLPLTTYAVDRAATHRAPPARFCSATTDRRTQSTPSNGQATCSRAATRWS